MNKPEGQPKKKYTFKINKNGECITDWYNPDVEKLLNSLDPEQSKKGPLGGKIIIGEGHYCG